MNEKSGFVFFSRTEKTRGEVRMIHADAEVAIETKIRAKKEVYDCGTHSIKMKFKRCGKFIVVFSHNVTSALLFILFEDVKSNGFCWARIQPQFSEDPGLGYISIIVRDLWDN